MAKNALVPSQHTSNTFKSFPLGKAWRIPAVLLSLGVRLRARTADGCAPADAATLAAAEAASRAVPVPEHFYKLQN